MQLGRNTALNLVGLVVPLLAALLTIPAFLSLIGEARYGVLTVVWLVVGYLGLVDLGLGPAVTHRLSRGSDSTEAARPRVYWTGLTASALLGLAAAAVLAPIAWILIDRVLPLDPLMRAELLAALPSVAAALPLSTASAVLYGALHSRERFGELTAITVIGNSAALFFPLFFAAFVEPTLPVLVGGVLLARLLTTMAMAWRCARHVTAGAPYSFDIDTAAALLRYGGWVSVSGFIGPLMVISDRFLIAGAMGAKAVSHYVVPFQLAERTTVLASALSLALFPRLARAEAEARLRLAEDALRVLIIAISPITAVCLVVIERFLAWWVGPELADAGTWPALFLFMGFWINALAFVPHTLLQAAGRPDLVARCHVAELVPYLLLLMLAVHWWGLAGAGAVFALRTAVDFALLARLAGLPVGALRRVALTGAGLLSIVAANLLDEGWHKFAQVGAAMALCVWCALQGRWLWCQLTATRA